MEQEQEKKQSNSSNNKEERRTMMDLKNIHTGSNETNPGILKAKAEKAKRDKILASLKKKKKS
jgi:hypothetical protein